MKNANGKWQIGQAGRRWLCLGPGHQLLPSPLAGEGLGVRGRSGQNPKLFFDGRLAAVLVLGLAAWSAGPRWGLLPATAVRRT